MNQKFKKHMMMKKALTAFVMLLAVTPVFAPVQKSIATNVKDFNFTKSICCYEKILPFNTY